MKSLATAQARVDAAQVRFDKSLQRQANATIAAAGIHRVGRGIMSGLASPLQQMRGVEAAKGELQSVGIEDTAAVIERGRAISRRLAGIDTAAFTSAAYDIKSGISKLSDSGVAEMTAAAALTAKATKADVGQMTSLFATAYGTYKDTLFANIGDAEFGQRFSASLAASVQQFKTTGAGMQQSIQSMGGGLAASGVPLAEQLAGLGMLQGTMEAGVAGTTLKALERTAAVAQSRFADMGLSIRTLDEKGNLRSLPDLLEEMQNTFGKNYSTEIGAMIQQAFGSDEAMPFFKQLWGQQAAFRANAAALEEAANQGERFTASMARRLDDNWDARLTIIGQRWNTVMERLGYKLVPVLERVIPAVEWVVDAIGNFIEKNPGLTTGLLGLAGVVGGLALIAAPVIVTVAALGTTLSWLGVKAAQANAAAAMGGMGGGKAGGRLRGMGGKLGVAGALTVGAMSIGSTLMDDSQSGTDKAASISRDVGTLGGGLLGAAKGAALGAAIGSVVPVLGTAVGGLLGTIVGGIGGSMAGGWLGDKVGGGIKAASGWFGGDDTPATQIAQAAATSQEVGVRNPAPVHHEDKRQYTLQIAQQPGEDADSLARRVMELLRNQDAAAARGALFDPL
jgi:TP901 family phage tail tape measure protein